MSELDLPIIWAGIIAFAVAMYVLLDGFDLGLGILAPFADTRDRARIMATVAPVWDGNETWLVLGGGGLLAAFPVAYATVLPAVYLPIILMLIALVLRGVAFEFHPKAQGRDRGLWDAAFAGGSTVAALMQGIVLGRFVEGFDAAAGPFAWATPFALMTGLGLVAGYALLGACWLVLKTDGHLQAWARDWAMRLVVVVLGFVGVVSLWTPLAQPAIAERWFAWPRLLLLSPVPLATVAAGAQLWQSLRRGRELAPFLLTVAIFLLAYLGLGISLWPYAVPRAITIWEAAASPSSLKFLLVGVVILIPIILAYTAHAYWVFRGKVAEGEGYH
ncbi:cytochrome d ubiquinol oxidase subunit II [Desertibaculum subflavum]|uniref:cytochrome d ubiquinol oxidase subunit II n=1 Tax=Desertibaculum subflavum TaxID=2268458 RepID=UPI000E668332